MFIGGLRRGWPVSEIEIATVSQTKLPTTVQFVAPKEIDLASILMLILTTELQLVNIWTRLSSATLK